MQKEGNASARDRQTALDLAIICESLERARGWIRWIPHGRMPVDAVTKDDFTKCNAALFDLMSSGRIVLVDEESEVDRRRAAPEFKDRSQSASRKMLAGPTWISWKEYLGRACPSWPGRW
eukprot:9483475-Pyramimonas_sp.AAC.1